MPSSAHRRRLAALVAVAALAVSVLSSCGLPGAASPEPTTTKADRNMHYEPIREALAAADPRVVDTGVVSSLSGAAKVLTVAVVLSGDDDVSTQELTVMLVAIRDSAPDDFDQLAQ